MKHSVYISRVRKFQAKLARTPARFMKKKRAKLSAEFVQFVSENQESALQDWKNENE